MNVPGSPTVYAMKVNGSAIIANTNTLTLDSGSMILNGGLVSGGTVNCGSQPALIYAGSSNPSTISSTLTSSSGLVKFGPGTLVLTGDNSSGLRGNSVISSGVLNIQNAGALGASNGLCTTMVAAGASLEIQGNIAVGNDYLYAQRFGRQRRRAATEHGHNSFAGPITLNSNAEVNTVSALTLSGVLQGSYDLTKTGSGTLVLAGGNMLFGSLNVAEGTLTAANSSALGLQGGIGATVSDGATLAVQGGISLPAAVVLSGSARATTAYCKILVGQNTLTGPVTLADDCQINVNAGSLTLSGSIGGGFALSESGAGTLVLLGQQQ